MIEISIPDELRQYIPGFLERRAQDIAQLRHYIAEENYASMATIAHKLKGTGASYGFPALSKLGEHLGQAIAARDQTLIFDLVEDYAEIVDELKRELI